MIKLITPGRIIFALGIIALGVLQFFTREYIAGRPPALEWPGWAAAMQGKFAWACVSGILFIIAGLAIIFNKRGGPAAIFIGVMFFVFSFLLRHLTAMAYAGNGYKSLALGGGAFIVAASFFQKTIAHPDRSLTNSNLILTGCIFLSLFLLWAGIAHFKFYGFVRDFIPAYIPFRPFWTNFTAVALLAGGIGIIFNATRKWAAALSGVMILLWFFLLHIPRTVNASQDYKEWMGLFESFSISGIFFVLAGLSSKK